MKNPVAPPIQPDAIPLKVDQDGVVRMAGHRIPLDTIVHAYWEGATPEEIVLRYDSLQLADVYSAIGYYLRHRAELDAYFADRERQAEAYIAEIESRQSWAEVKERLLARQRAQHLTAAD